MNTLYCTAIRNPNCPFELADKFDLDKTGKIATHQKTGKRVPVQFDNSFDIYIPCGQDDITGFDVC